jgi:hypothetical protein
VRWCCLGCEIEVVEAARGAAGRRSSERIKDEFKGCFQIFFVEDMLRGFEPNQTFDAQQSMPGGVCKTRRVQDIIMKDGRADKEPERCSGMNA